jgi:hypothetical protein
MTYSTFVKYAVLMAVFDLDRAALHSKVSDDVTGTGMDTVSRCADGTGGAVSRSCRRSSRGRAVSVISV